MEGMAIGLDALVFGGIFSTCLIFTSWACLLRSFVWLRRFTPQPYKPWLRIFCLCSVLENCVQKP